MYKYRPKGGLHNLENQERRNDVIIGRNPVLEALRGEREIDTVFVAKGDRTGVIKKIAAMAAEKGIPVKDVSPQKLEFMAAGENHQGVCAVAAVRKYVSVDDIFTIAEERGEPPFIIIADEIADPHNLGAIIRTAEAVGAHGVIVPKRRAAGLTASVGRASAGAVEYVAVARVSNLAQTIDILKDKGVWVYAADMDGGNWCQTDMTGAVALVVGGEDGGVGRLIKEKCDFVLSLPMNGQINSLNASVAGAVFMYEIARQRAGIEAINKKK
ncbi:MAG: 23S rRNA (guanosine(2251)-2'-O)-methyltransferase RlmB [Oscillospiraceae bacterium]|jgi:23S rRNA (guanosine2251-2'-O)-methyltransferase|nr:23S rRNA (guanosine(2251)-2'-O)-methyltransferase RlmB [Oscillospiraceae bacterium]